MLRPWCVLPLFLAGCPAPPSPDPPEAAPTATATVTATASAAPEPSAAPANVGTLFVDAKIVDCQGEGPMKCMRVRETPTGEWTLFYERIEGFTHEPGHSYELKVEVTDVAGPPQGGSTKRHRLVEIVSKKKEAP